MELATEMEDAETAKQKLLSFFVWAIQL